MEDSVTTTVAFRHIRAIKAMQCEKCNGPTTIEEVYQQAPHKYFACIMCTIPMFKCLKCGHLFHIPEDHIVWDDDASLKQ